MNEKEQWCVKTEAGTYRVGITPYSVKQLGQIVYIEGECRTVKKDEPVVDIESNKAVSACCAIADGEVIAINDCLSQHPERLAEITDENKEDYWLFEQTVKEQGNV